MAVDVVAAASPATAASTTGTTTAADQAQFDQAFAQYLPAAASFMLMSVAQDAVQEMMQAGDDNADAPDPAG
jgi:hypothetical protein